MSIKIYFPRMLLIIFRYNSPRNEILEIKNTVRIMMIVKIIILILY